MGFLCHLTEEDIFLPFLAVVTLFARFLKYTLMLESGSDMLVHELVNFCVCPFPGLVEVIEKSELPCPPGSEIVRTVLPEMMIWEPERLLAERARRQGKRTCPV